MTAVLVSLAELDQFLGPTPEDDAEVLQAILDHVEQLFLQETHRKNRPFLATADTNARTEVKDGTGSPLLTLDYPISELATDITLGLDTTDPDETLEYDDVEQVVWVAGRRSIERTDGGTWGCVGTPRYVRVTYKAAADMPETGKLAIKRACAILYRQRGSEEAERESLEGYSRELAAFDQDPIWRLAINGQREPRL